jgi:ABC-type multidrug transport system fused ATPase/permease subunit
MKLLVLKCMKTTGLYALVWSLLTKAERRRALILGVYLTIGTVLEVLSVGVLVPLIQVLTKSNLQSKYPMINRIFPNSSDQFIVVMILVGVICIFILKELFLGFSFWVQRGFVARLETRFQSDLFDRYTRQPYEFHLTNNSSLLSRNILNSTNFSNNILDPMFMLLTDGFVTIALCVVLVAIEPIAMLLTICSVGVVAGIFHGFSKRRIVQWGAERQLQDGIKLQQLSETFGGIKEIVMTGREEYFRRRFSSNIVQLAHLNRKFTTLLGVPRLYLELLSVAGLAALVISMLAIGKSLESLLPLLALFAGGAFRLMPAINRITFAFQSLRMGRPIVEALQTNISSQDFFELKKQYLEPIKFMHSIRFEDITYSYPNAERSVIDGMNFEIVKGSEVGIVGTTGAGKSTLVDILLGLLRPDRGQVTVDGVDIATNIRGWQDLVGYVPQSIFLMDSSIRANIAFGIDENEIDDEKVMRALNFAQLTDLVDELPNGMNEFVGERGVRLSGGQQQRIGIARALYRDPPILVFDEATSALDVETEKEVMKSIEQLRTDRTIVIVTHRLSALEKCDQIIAIENGTISSLHE